MNGHKTKGAGASAPVSYCVARADANGRAIPGSRLTDDVRIWEALKALERLRQAYPSARVFSGSQVAGRR